MCEIHTILLRTTRAQAVCKYGKICSPTVRLKTRDGHLMFYNLLEERKSFYMSSFHDHTWIFVLSILMRTSWYLFRTTVHSHWQTDCHYRWLIINEKPILMPVLLTYGIFKRPSNSDLNLNISFWTHKIH